LNSTELRLNFRLSGNVHLYFCVCLPP